MLYLLLITESHCLQNTTGAVPHSMRGFKDQRNGSNEERRTRFTYAQVVGSPVFTLLLAAAVVSVTPSRLLHTSSTLPIMPPA